MKLWETATGREIIRLKVPGLDGHRPSVTCVAFSPDGRRLVSGGDDKVARIWDPTTGQELLTLPGHTGKVNGVAFSPDGRRLASVSQDGTLKIWETARPEEAAAWQKEEKAGTR